MISPPYFEFITPKYYIPFLEFTEFMRKAEKKDSRKNQAPTLIQCIEKEGKTVADIANALGVASTQVYKWNREGIKETCKHYNNLKAMIP